MKIDKFYDEQDKSSYYLGLISQVYKTNAVVQVENLSLLTYRKILFDTLIPNTINYYVVIDADNGLFLGKIYQSKIPNNDNVHEMFHGGKRNSIFPEIGIKILGFISPGNDMFQLPGLKNVGIANHVYIANKKVVECFINSVEVHSRETKKLPSFGRLEMSQTEVPVELHPSTLFDRHLMVVGTTNSGKSTSSLAILNQLINNGIKVLIIDPTGEYEGSFDKKDGVSKYRLGDDTFIATSTLSMQQWNLLFETNDSTQPGVLADAIRALRFQKKYKKENEPYEKEGKAVYKVYSDMSKVTEEDKDFNIEKLPEQIIKESVEEAPKTGTYKHSSFRFNSNKFLSDRIKYKLDTTSLKKFFSSNGQNLLNKIDEFSENKEGSIYINASKIGTTDGVGEMIVDLINNYLLNSDKKTYPFVIFIDEVHRYTRNVKDSGLTNMAREGRKKGMFLFLTTQNPNDVDPILLGQVGTLLIHRLTSDDEINAIKNHLSDHEYGEINKLNTGEAILTSINLLMDLHLKITPSSRHHNHETPSLWID